VSGPGPPVLGRVPAIRSGTVPALADGFTNRPESAPGLAVLDPGTAVALVCAAASRPEQPAGPCGKTQLAVQAAESLWRSGRVELLAWIDASSRASVLSGYGEAAAAAGIRSACLAEEVAARLTNWLAETTRPWLVVLDDVRDAADLAGLWPCGPAGRVVITSPDEQAVCGERSELQPQVCPVGPFSTREALNYLMGRLADDPDQRHGAIDLAATLDGDPVALTHASAVIATATQSCADYQRHYAHKRARLGARQAHGEPLVAPAVTWILSAERASQLSPGGATQLLLVLAALLDGQAVPAAMFTTPAACKYLAEAGASAADADRAWEAVRALAHTGLLTIDLAPAPPVVRVSRLVAALVRAATPEQVLERAAVGAADALLEIWPQREPRPWLAAGLRSCVDALQRTSADRLWVADACHPLLLKAGHSLDSGGLSGPSVRHWAQLATTGNRILGSAHPGTLAVGSHLAHALQTAGQATEATAWWQWVADGSARAFGPDYPGTLAARVSLGNAMAVAGQPGSAVGVLEQAVADNERVRGAGHPDTFRARDGLAAACQAAGLAAEAIGHYRRVLADHERLNGTRHPAAMTARSKLAAAYLADGRLKDAITCYKKTLADRQHALGADHPDTITACRNLAAAYQAAGKIAAALQLCEQVRVGQERILGANHPHTLACRADLAHAYIGAGRLADAATLLRDTLTRCEQALPPGDPLTEAVRQALTGLAGQ
jgi:tetratricopeptide (TPR) repeat protein